MQPLYITNYSAVNALGYGKSKILSSLLEERTGLDYCDFDGAALDTYIGKVNNLEEFALNEQYSRYDCRNNRLANACLHQDGFPESVRNILKGYASDRVAVIIGTSTSGIEELEQAYRRRDSKTGALPTDKELRYTYNLFSVTDFVSTYFNLHGPAYTISTACSSSAKVFATASRLIDSGLCDAAIVGGVDSLCLNTLHGFNSLQILSNEPCRPFSEDRSGISIGEGAGFALLEHQPRSVSSDIRFLGYGESTDAYHMSSPPADGAGAARSMSLALESAKISGSEIDYINLHGTGSDINDSSETNAIITVFGEGKTAVATKGYTGHTLGAAGITEAIITFLSMENQFIPRTINTSHVDSGLNIKLSTNAEDARIKNVMSNSFGFGGNNCSLIFGE